MLDFINVIADFLTGLFSLHVPALGISYGALILGALVLYLIGYLIFHGAFFGGDK